MISMIYSMMTFSMLIVSIIIANFAKQNWLAYMTGIILFLISCFILIMKISAERAEMTRKIRKPFESLKDPDLEYKKAHDRLLGIMLLLAGLVLSILIVMLFGLWIDPEYELKLIYVLFMAFMIGIWALICFKNGINKIRTNSEEEG